MRDRLGIASLARRASAATSKAAARRGTSGRVRPPVEDAAAALSTPTAGRSRRRLRTATYCSTWTIPEIHSCGLLKKEASIVCHGASGEKLCCASKQEHCCIYDEGSIKPLFITTLVVVIILGLFLMLQCWRWSRPEPRR